MEVLHSFSNVTFLWTSGTTLPCFALNSQLMDGGGQSPKFIIMIFTKLVQQLQDASDNR